MKVLLTIKTLDNVKGGAERVLVNLADGLYQHGHDVSILTVDKPGTVPAYKVEKGIRTLFAAPMFLGARANERTNLLAFISRIYSVRRIIRREKPDVIVSFMHSMFVPVSLSIIGLGIPHIVSEHIVPEHYKNKPVQYFLLVMAALIADKMTVVLPGIAKLYPRLIQRKIVAIPNAVSPDTVGIRIETGTKKTILSVGRLDPQKDQSVLIDAFLRLAPDYPHWRLRIIGAGPLYDQLLEKIGKSSYGEQISLHGVTNQISMEYSVADIFAIPSKYESFGLATAEALMSGVPAIGFVDCPGTNELIVNDVNGLLVSGEDRVEALANGLEKLMMDADLRKRLGAVAPSTVEKFSIENVLDQWEDLIESVAEKKLKPPAA